MVKLNNLTSKSSELYVLNEGRSEQEYVIKWELTDNTSTVIDKGSFSKNIKANESETFLIVYKELTKAGKYLFVATVEYGIYKSEASAIITIKETGELEYTVTITKPQANKTILFFMILALISLISIVLLVAKRRRKKKPAQKVYTFRK